MVVLKSELRSQEPQDPKLHKTPAFLLSMSSNIHSDSMNSCRYWTQLLKSNKETTFPSVNAKAEDVK